MRETTFSMLFTLLEFANFNFCVFQVNALFLKKKSSVICKHLLSVIFQILVANASIVICFLWLKICYSGSFT